MRRTAATTALVLMVAAAIQLASPSPASAVTLPSGFQLVDYPTGQAQYNLTDFAWLDDGSLLTSGKDGTITVLPPGGSPRFIAKVPGVRANGDHGLLGFALANDYATTGRVYVTYDKGDPRGTGFGMVEEWKATPAASPTSFTKTRTLIDGSLTSPQLEQTTANHGIDTVLVAPDDSLYVSIGDDSDNNGDPHSLRAQDTTQPYGKVLHLTPDGAGVPANPFYSASAPSSWRSRVYAYGLRNPFRFSIDPRSGALFTGDVGRHDSEEIDILRAGTNSGWPCYEGTAKTSFSAAPVCTTLYAAGTAQPPIWAYPHAGAGAAVVAGMLYTGTTYPAQYRTSFFLGDYVRGKVWTLATDVNGHMTRAPEANGFSSDAGGPVAFHAGPNGDVTYADLLSGKVRRLVYSAGNRPPVARFTTTSDPDTRTVTFSAADSYDLDDDALTYSWSFGDDEGGQGVSTTHTYDTDDPVQVTLTATDQLGATGQSTMTIHPANHTPQLTVDEPTGTFAVGDPVELTAEATDPEDGPLTVEWDTALLHCPFAGSCHRHPEGTVSGPSYSHAFTDHGADTTMLVTAHVEDSLGAVASTTYEATPTLHTVVVNSPIPVTINGETVTSAQVVSGSLVQLNAPLSSAYWQFDSWSDAGAAAHSFTMPDADRTLSVSYVTAIEKRYAALGGASSVLGDPTGAEYVVAGGRARNFSGGRLYWTQATGARMVTGAILAKYLAAGGPAALGFPAADSLAVPGGRASYFTRGRVYWSTSTGAHVLRAPLLAKYLSGGGPAALGLPTTDATVVPGGWAAYFTRGRIYWSSSAGTHLLRGVFLAKYLSAGGPGRYGLPATDMITVPGGAYARFTGNRYIFWSAATGAHLVYAPILAKYAAVGSYRSCLGFPTSDQFATRRGVRTNFRGGYILRVAKTRRTVASC